MSWRDTILKDGVDRRVQGPRREMRLDKPPMRNHPKLRPNPVPDGYFKEKSEKEARINELKILREGLKDVDPAVN